jgi:molecular chaperone IbpA
MTTQNYFYTTLPEFYATDFIKTLDAHLGRKPENYPPYNIITPSENHFIIEIALAGFSTTDIEIHQLAIPNSTQTKLIISKKSEKTEENKVCSIKKYIHNGIADRSFSKEFVLKANMVVKKCNMENGMLRLYIEHVIPESQKPIKIEIGN